MVLVSHAQHIAARSFWVRKSLSLAGADQRLAGVTVNEGDRLCSLLLAVGADRSKQGSAALAEGLPADGHGTSSSA